MVSVLPPLSDLFFLAAVVVVSYVGGRYAVNHPDRYGAASTRALVVTGVVSLALLAPVAVHLYQLPGRYDQARADRLHDKYGYTDVTFIDETTFLAVLDGDHLQCHLDLSIAHCRIEAAGPVRLPRS
jgi:hypothetical protein